MDLHYTSFKKSGKFAYGFEDNDVTIPAPIAMTYTRIVDDKYMSDKDRREHINMLRYDARQIIETVIQQQLDASGLAYAVLVDKNGIADTTNNYDDKLFDALIGYPMLVINPNA